MADNTELTAGSGGDTIATDDIAGVKHQRVKVQYGDDGSATDVSDTNPLPVDDAGGSLSVDDGGTSLTVDGTVAATQSGTWTVQPGNTANTTAWKVDGSAVTQPVSGTVTVQDGGGAITVDNAGTFAVQADTELTTADLDTGAGTDTRAVVGLAGTASGGAQLIPGSSTDGLLVNLGANNDVTVTGTVTANAGSGPFPVSDNGGSLTVDNGGTFAVQAAQSGTWTVQPGNTANTTAWKVDASSVAVPITDNSGSLTVDNAGTFAVQDSQVVTDNAAFTDGTTKVQPVGYVFDEVAGTALTENDAAAARIDSKRAQIGVLEDATTRGQRAAVSAAGALKVDGSAVTQPVSGTVTASNTAGDIAHDSADSGNPVKVGAKAGTADITAVANADRTDLRADTLGHLIVRPYALHENLVSGATSAITTTTSTSVIASAGAGVRNYITTLTVFNSHASVSTTVDITDGSGGTVLHRGYALAGGGGYTISFPTPLRGSAATAVHAVCGTTGANVYVSASGYKAAV